MGQIRGITLADAKLRQVLDEESGVHFMGMKTKTFYNGAAVTCKCKVMGCRFSRSTDRCELSTAATAEEK